MPVEQPVRIKHDYSLNEYHMNNEIKPNKLDFKNISLLNIEPDQSLAHVLLLPF